jgi:hypothetical protein
LIRFRAEALLDTSRPHPDFREVLGDLPARAYAGRGMALGARGEWSAALADLRRAVEGTGAQGDTSIAIHFHSILWLYLSVLELELDDREAYRQRCRQMIDRFSRSAAASDRERTAKAGLLVPPPSPEEVERLRSIARAAVERAGPDDPWVPWFLFALGLAEYRAGDAGAAVQALDRCLGRTPGATTAVPALSVQAMALTRLGRAEEAGDRLARAERLLSEHLPTVTASDWPDRMIARRIAREAEAVVRLDPIFPADPFAP